jgi:serine phosphatase RsbU (regulator of sigma subunit)
MLVAACRDEEQLQTMRALGMTSVMLIPLTSRGKTLGVISFISSAESERPFNQEDLAFAEGLGQHAGIAIDNALIFKEAEVEIAERKKAEERLVAMAAEIAEISKREHNIASQLSDALQPPLPTVVPGLALKHHYHAALEEAGVGGDFYDVFPTDKGCVALVVGDLSGKGLAAAAQVATVRNMLRYAVYNDGALADAVTQLNRTLAQNNLLIGFATLFVGIYDSGARMFTYVSCGQEPGLVRRAATGEVEELPATGPVLGTWAEVDYEARAVSLRPGDAVAIFTDGLTEAGPCHTDLLGVEGVTRLMRGHAGAPRPAQQTADDLVNRLVAGVEAFAHGSVSDDVCLLVAVVGGETAPDA